MPAKKLFEDAHLITLLHETNGNIAECAKTLGVARSSITSRIQRTKNPRLTKAYLKIQKKKEDAANLLNRKFGHRLVIAKGMIDENGRQFWVCECKCGDIKEIKGSYLLSGRSQQCTKCNLIKHGMKNTPEYFVWCNIVQRCCNKNNPEYPNYGGRGITICDEYRYDFLRFFTDIGNRPSENFSIGRIDNEKGYEIGNIQWETSEEQTNNRRITLKVDGKNISCNALSKKLGIDRETIRRMANLGCTMNELERYPTLDWQQRREFFKQKESPTFSK